MPKYSRSAKYEELRSSLQSDSESGLHTPDLSQYEQRLNKIAPAYFEAPESTPAPETMSPIRARRAAVYPQSEPVQPISDEPAPGPGAYSKQYFQNNANYTTAINNEYIDEYIKEVKKYNIDQGNALSANTDLDILRGLRGETPRPPAKPYPDEEEPVAIQPLRQERPVKKEPEPRPAVQETGTADISFPNKPQPKKEQRRPQVEYLDDEDETEENDYRSGGDTRTMSKDDIAAEVQRLINGAQQKRESSSKGKKRNWLDETDDSQFYDERSTREQLLNETTQMRAQLDDYEDNLKDVNDKMKHTNQILNIVLIILIVALALVLAVVIYWVLLSKGVIS